MKELNAMQLQTIQLVDDLDKAWARKHEYNLNELKKFPSAQVILKSPPALRAFVVQRILKLFGEFGARRIEKGNPSWAPGDRFPWGCIYIVSSLLKRPLPFSDQDFGEMFGSLLKAGFINASQFEFIGPLIGALARHAEKLTLSPRLRNLIRKFSDMLMGRGMGRPEEWPPSAADRKAAARIQRILAGPMVFD